VENGFKIFSVMGIASWLLNILPTESLSKWAWLAIAGSLAGGLLVFSRRLLYWHGQWQNSLEDPFGDNQHASRPGQRQWLESSSDWGIQAQDLILPENAACSGRSIADLRVRSHFGCSIVEINRGRHTIISPDPTQILYSGDRLLLLGTPAQLAAAREGLEQVKAVEELADFEDARLETVIVPAGPRVGLSLAELAILRQTGVLVAGIQRGGEKIVNPVGGDRLNEGDELLILGSPQQIRNFKGWLLYYCAEGLE
jgi:CPA2 family monovalent cation:H+ antiporter-2